MKIKIEIKNRWTGKVLFEYEKEDNTVKDTLIEAIKSGATLCGADLRDADLCDADLRDADLCGADLRDADLCGANLCDADLCGADLRDADLCGADLRGADLRDADLCGANLCDADLRDADLCDADLRDAKEVPFVPFACPSDGAFIGWKKVRECLIQLEIPADARRQSAIGTKCRCDKAKVLGIVNLKTNEAQKRVTNNEYAPLDYIVGEMVYPDSFDDDRWNECSHGIHFFINKQEAINY